MICIYFNSMYVCIVFKRMNFQKNHITMKIYINHSMYVCIVLKRMNFQKNHVTMKIYINHLKYVNLNVVQSHREIKEVFE